jgi:hypothetical protein
MSLLSPGAEKGAELVSVVAVSAAHRPGIVAQARALLGRTIPFQERISQDQASLAGSAPSAILLFEQARGPRETSPRGRAKRSRFNASQPRLTANREELSCVEQ